MLKMCAPGPRSVSSFGDSVHYIYLAMNYMVNLNFIYLHVALMVGFKVNVYKDNKVLFYE